MPAADYKPKSAAIFIGKDLGWVEFQEPSIKPPYPPTDSWTKNETTLYLSIASFRDTLCPKTLFNAFSKAANPQRLTIGVVQQNAPGDIDCLDNYCELMNAQTGDSSCKFKENIRIMRVPSNTAKGPTWGRAKASTLLRDEEFCMQTDAHMDFVPNWDMKMMQMWADTNNEYAVLSTYVADAEQLPYNLDGQKGMNNVHEVPHLCMVTLNGAHGLVRVWGTKCARLLPKPKLTNAIWGAGLSFSKCHAERKAAYDPHTPFIFDGEEFSRAVRFWTWGYDIYTPHRVFVVHNYKVSQSDPNHFDWYRTPPDPSEGTVEQSVFRLKTLLEIPGGETDPAKRAKMHQSKYGLGDRRTLDQAIAFSGIDTRNQRILGNRCGNLEYVPFKEHPFGASYVPAYDPVTEAFTDVRDPGSIYYNESSEMMVRQWEQAQREWQRKRASPSKRRVLGDTGSTSSTGNAGSAGSVSGLDGANVRGAPIDFFTPRHRNHVDSVALADTSSFGNQVGYGASVLFVVLFVAVGLCCSGVTGRRFHMGKHTRLADKISEDLSVAIKAV